MMDFNAYWAALPTGRTKLYRKGGLEWLTWSLDASRGGRSITGANLTRGGHGNATSWHKSLTGQNFMVYYNPGAKYEKTPISRSRCTDSTRKALWQFMKDKGC